MKKIFKKDVREMKNLQAVSGRCWLCDFSVIPAVGYTCCSVPSDAGFAVPIPSAYWSPIPLFSRLSPRPVSRLEAATASAKSNNYRS